MLHNNIIIKIVATLNLMEVISMDFQEELTNELYHAIKMILMDLFRNQEHYYYITLITDGGVHTPCISAWSYEAFYNNGINPEKQESIKWSYADSPYCCWKQEKFEKVEKLLLSRKNIWDLNSEEFETEYNLRLEAMEMAMKRLDQEGIFGINQKRCDVVVLAEVMPPDSTNTARAYRMNPTDSEIFSKWLEEAAEPLDNL